MEGENLKEKFENFCKIVDNANKHQNVPKWFKPFINHIKAFAGDLTKYVDHQNSKIAIQETIIKRLEDDRDRLRMEMDDMQQYSRRTCLLIHGMKEERNENCEGLVKTVVNEKLKAGLDTKDIGRTHRLGKRKPDGKPRPIIVRFLSYRQRAKVFALKKNLKGSKIVITENLTKQRYSLLQKCNEVFEKTNVWSYDGRINVKLDTQIKTFTNMEELNLFLTVYER